MRVKILTILGTRPEAIKLFPVIHALQTAPHFESRVCITGQHGKAVDEVLSVAAIRPDHDLSAFRAGQTADGLASAVLQSLGSVLKRYQPAWVVVQGDTTSALAAALCAHYHAIPVCHVEAGLRSGDLDNPWPEEAHRRMIATIASVHCAPTELAAAALRAENVSPAKIHVTGNTVIDAVHWMKRAMQGNPNLHPSASEILKDAADRRIILLTMHRRESWGGPLRAVAAAIRAVAQRTDVFIVIPMHPNPEVQSVFVEELADVPNVRLVASLSYPDFIFLLSECDMVISDSGGVQEEAPVFGKPLLILRSVTERSEGVAGRTAELVGTDSATVVQAINDLLDDPARHSMMSARASYYGDGAAAPRILAALCHATTRAASSLDGSVAIND